MTLLVRAELEKWIESYTQIKPAEPYDHPPSDALFTTTDWLRADHLMEEIRKGTFTAQADGGLVANAEGLLPCPFCGPGMSQVSLWENDYKRWQVGCGACGSHSGTCATKERATQLWNTRPSHSGWQPMETAPKDGTLILAMAGGYGLLCFKKGYWIDCEGRLWRPHAWMPLPLPPSPEVKP